MPADRQTTRPDTRGTTTGPADIFEDFLHQPRHSRDGSHRPPRHLNVYVETCPVCGRCAAAGIPAGTVFATSAQYA